MLSPEHLIMAKPGIPYEHPRRRTVPDVAYPTPKRIPIPSTPIRLPQEPVPLRR